jgi:hypothetical protein
VQRDGAAMIDGSATPVTAQAEAGAHGAHGMHGQGSDRRLTARLGRAATDGSWHAGKAAASPVLLSRNQ